MIITPEAIITLEAPDVTAWAVFRVENQAHSDCSFVSVNNECPCVYVTHLKICLWANPPLTKA